MVQGLLCYPNITLLGGKLWAVAWKKIYCYIRKYKEHISLQQDKAVPSK